MALWRAGFGGTPGWGRRWPQADLVEAAFGRVSSRVHPAHNFRVASDPETIAEGAGVLQIRVADLSCAHPADASTCLDRANSSCTAAPAWAREFEVAKGDYGTTRNLLVGKIANGGGGTNPLGDSR